MTSWSGTRCGGAGMRRCRRRPAHDVPNVCILRAGARSATARAHPLLLCGSAGAMLRQRLPSLQSASRVNPQLLRSLADRYAIERELGRGGMATVYLARDARHHRRVAIKVLHPELAAVARRRAVPEARSEVTAELQHPHILPLFDSGERRRAAVLRDAVRRRRDAARAARAREAAAGRRRAAHRDARWPTRSSTRTRHGVIHRDIKPENILLHDGHGARRRLRHRARRRSTPAGERMTQTGLSLGTPQYMAPEQAMGERASTPARDIYALGAVTYEMLAGEPPFTGPTRAGDRREGADRASRAPPRAARARPAGASTPRCCARWRSCRPIGGRRRRRSPSR